MAGGGEPPLVSFACNCLGLVWVYLNLVWAGGGAVVGVRVCNYLGLVWVGVGVGLVGVSVGLLGVSVGWWWWCHPWCAVGVV